MSAIRALRIPAFAILAALLASSTHGQITTGSILGVVADESGARIPGVTVSITNSDTGITRTLTTDAAGRYRAANLALGQYEVKAGAAGFKTAVRRGIQLTVGAEAVVDLTLSVGTITEQVEVMAEAPLVETTNATVSGLVSDQQVRDLPLNGRSFESLVFLQTGVVPFLQGAKSTEAGEGTKLAMSGSRIDSNSFLLDGANMNDQANMTPGSAAGVLLGVDTLREFRVLTSNYSAEYGRVSGGIINAVTKSGTNELHGNVFEYLRNAKLDARNFFDKQKPAFKRNQFGGTAGGRIIRDRTFWFVGYEGFRERLGATLLSFVPIAEARNGFLRDSTGQFRSVPVDPRVKPYLELFPLPNGPALQSPSGVPTNTATFLTNPPQPTREDFTNIRIDQQLSANHSFFVRYTLDDSETIFPRANRLTSPNSSRNQYATVSETAIVSSALVNVSRMAVARSFSVSDSKLLYDVPRSLWFFPEQAQFGLITFRSGGLSSLGTVLGLPQQWAHETWTYADDLTASRGRQTLKMGFLFDRYRENSLKLRILGGQYFFSDLQSFLQDNPAELQFQPPGNEFNRGMRQFLVAGYLQDDVQVRPNLTLNLGLRYEFASVPTEVHGRVSNYPDPTRDVAAAPHIGDPWFHGSTKDFEPRVGVAWDPFSNGKTSLRAGFGLHHDHTVGSPYNRAFTFTFPFSQLVALRNNPAGAVDFPRLNPNLIRAPDPLSMVSFGVARDLPDPVKVGWTLGLQQEIANNMVVTATYVGSHTYHTSLGYNGNPAVEQTDPVTGRRFVPQPARFRNPNLGQVQTFYRNNGNAFYEGLQTSVKRRMTKGFQAQLSYTWSKTISEGDGVLSRFLNSEGRTGGNYVSDPDDIRGERSLALTHFPHTATVNFSYELPWARNLQGAAGTILSGWAVNGVVSATTGNPLGLNLGFDRTNSRVRGGGLSDRPDLKPGGNNNPVLGGPNRYYDPTQFVLPPVGFFGNLGRLTLFGPGMATVDFSLVKNARIARISEAATLQFRAEVFNLLNRANFSLPFNQPLTSSGAVDSRAGNIDRTNTSSRQIQFAMKLVF